MQTKDYSGGKYTLSDSENKTGGILWQVKPPFWLATLNF
jgi:hypothetical protein